MIPEEGVQQQHQLAACRAARRIDLNGMITKLSHIRSA
jgi:hypothetical protein